MATLGTNAYTLLDHAKRTDSTGKQQLIAELLTQNNSILDDIVFKEANLMTGEQVAIRTGLPTAYWRKHNQPIPSSSSTTAQNTFPIKELVIWGSNDSGLMELGGDLSQTRLNELTALTESINQEFASNIFYGDVNVDEGKFSGFATTYNSLSGEIYNAGNIIDAGGTGSDNASIYLVCHGINKVYCAFPKGSKAGLQHTDHGKQVSETSDGFMNVYREELSFKSTLAIKDWRYAGRICNIDVSNLGGGSAADLPELMIELIEAIPSLDGACFYMNKKLMKHLRLQTRNDVISGGGLTYRNVAGERVGFFDEIPVKRVDALLNTEAAVS